MNLNFLVMKRFLSKSKVISIVINDEEEKEALKIMKLKLLQMNLHFMVNLEVRKEIKDLLNGRMVVL